MIDRCLGRNRKGLFINQTGIDILPKMIYDGIHDGKITGQLHDLTLTVVHVHHGRPVLVQVKIPRPGNDGLIQNLGGAFNPINTEIHNCPVLVGVSDNIVEIIVPHKGVGTERVCGSSMTELLPFILIVLKVFERDFRFLIIARIRVSTI